MLSNRAIWRVVRDVMSLAPRLLVLGGGGYNPWSVGRCWAGVWATLNGFDPAVPPNAEARAVLEGLTWHRSQGRCPPRHWFDTLADEPRPGPVRREVRAMILDVLRS
jgi:acetoin utilization protein AcuC